jgi:ribosomal protein S18 acetylase RimI-like enzyme
MLVAMSVEIREIRSGDAPSYRAALDAVCRERRFLAGLAAPSPRATQAFVDRNLARDHPHYVAVDGGAVVGWCDAIPGEASSGTAHVARMGMAVARSHRRRGIGRRLMEAVIGKARRNGIEKIELSVYASNAGAVALYLSAGFGVEGRKLRGRLVDGSYDDVLLLGLLLR